jgi:hypothetical protein
MVVLLCGERLVAIMLCQSPYATFKHAGAELLLETARN